MLDSLLLSLIQIWMKGLFGSGINVPYPVCFKTLCIEMLAKHTQTEKQKGWRKCYQESLYDRRNFLLPLASSLLAFETTMKTSLFLFLRRRVWPFLAFFQVADFSSPTHKKQTHAISGFGLLMCQNWPSKGSGTVSIVEYIGYRNIETCALVISLAILLALKTQK